MKKVNRFFSMMMLCMGLIASLVSCSDNDDDTPAVPAAESVAGTYSGNMTCSVMGSESVFEAMEFTLKATDDASVEVVIPSFGNPPMQLPQITIPGIAVSGTEGKYTLATKEFSGTTGDGKAYSGTIQGNVTDNTLMLQFNLQYGAMPMPMICSFTAPKK